MEAILGALRAAGDVASLKKAIRAASNEMKESGEERIGLADALLAPMAHADARVRQEVAETIDLWPEPFFSHAYETLKKDDNQLVRAAADRASKRRGAAEKGRAAREARGRELEEEIAKLAKHGEAARKIGERIAKLAGAGKAGEARHELSRAIDALAEPIAELEEAPPGEMRTRVAKVRERYEDLDALMHGLLGARPVFEDLSLRELVEKARENVLAVVGREVDVTIDVARGVRLEADAPSLRQAVENAMKNAAEAQRGREGAVRVRAATERDGAVVELAIEDCGPGMDGAELARSAVPFESKKVGGTGVGMTMMKRIVQRVHQGELRVLSEKGRGTRVVMRLPGKQVKR